MLKTLAKTVLIAILAYTPVCFAHIQIHLNGIQAKRIYNQMTGSGVDNEGAAGHLYRKGKSVLCRYTNADITDSHGNNVPADAASRYVCTIKFNRSGLASPGNNP